MTRFNKDKQIANESGEQRTEKGAVAKKPLQVPNANFKQVNHSENTRARQLPAKGFKQVGK